MDQKIKRVLYRSWSLRNQFNGEWDNYYFPKLAKALDILFPDSKYPYDMLPSSVKAVRTRKLKKSK